MKDSIALIGFMASGKSTIGRILASRLGKEFVELDALIEKRASKQIPLIFAEDGEEGFRQLEITVLQEVLKGDNLVISCGGGIVLKSINIERLKQKAMIFLLTASPQVLLQRVLQDCSIRPLLNGEDKLGKIEKLLALRQPLYESAADIVLDNTELDTESSVEAIINRLK